MAVYDDYEQVAREIYNKYIYNGWDADYDEFMDSFEANIEEGLDSWWNLDDFDIKKLEQTVKEVFDLLNSPAIKRYGDKLELSDNRTMWNIDAPMQDETDYYVYSDIVNEAIDMFKDQEGIDLGVEGRSGRHITVEDTYDNAKNYFELCDKVQDYEDWVIKGYTEYAKDRYGEDFENYDSSNF